MPLPFQVVKEIHARLAIRYGSLWAAKWAGIDDELVKADWAEQLDGMQPGNVRRALDNLPDDFPPSAPAFRALGVNHQPPPLADIPKLPPPDPAAIKRINAETAKLRRPEVIAANGAAECLERLRALRAAGVASAGQRAFLKAAELGMGGQQSAVQMGDFTPIPDSVLPPGMRAGA